MTPICPTFPPGERASGVRTGRLCSRHCESVGAWILGADRSWACARLELPVRRRGRAHEVCGPNAAGIGDARGEPRGQRLDEAGHDRDGARPKGRSSSALIEPLRACRSTEILTLLRASATRSNTLAAKAVQPVW